MKFAATVAAYGHQGRRGASPVEPVPRATEQPVDEGRAQLQEFQDIASAVKFFRQEFPRPFAGLPQRGDRPGLRPAGRLESLRVDECRRYLAHQNSSWLRAVSTSTPPAVTASVCSHWAERRPSLVVTVQPSRLSFT